MSYTSWYLLSCVLATSGALRPSPIQLYSFVTRILFFFFFFSHFRFMEKIRQKVGSSPTHPPSSLLPKSYHSVCKEVCVWRKCSACQCWVTRWMAAWLSRHRRSAECPVEAAFPFPLSVICLAIKFSVHTMLGVPSTAPVFCPWWAWREFEN